MVKVKINWYNKMMLEEYRSLGIPRSFDDAGYSKHSTLKVDTFGRLFDVNPRNLGKIFIMFSVAPEILLDNVWISDGQLTSVSEAGERIVTIPPPVVRLRGCIPFHEPMMREMVAGWKNFGYFIGKDPVKAISIPLLLASGEIRVGEEEKHFYWVKPGYHGDGRHVPGYFLVAVDSIGLFLAFVKKVIDALGEKTLLAEKECVLVAMKACRRYDRIMLGLKIAGWFLAGIVIAWATQLFVHPIIPGWNPHRFRGYLDIFIGWGIGLAIAIVGASAWISWRVRDIMHDKDDQEDAQNPFSIPVHDGYLRRVKKMLKTRELIGYYLQAFHDEEFEVSELK